MLGLDLASEDGRVRVYRGTAAVPYADELILRLDAMVEHLVLKEGVLADELAAMTEKAAQEKAKAAQEKARAERLAAKLRELGVEPEGS